MSLKRTAKPTAIKQQEVEDQLAKLPAMGREALQSLRQKPFLRLKVGQPKRVKSVSSPSESNPRRLTTQQIGRLGELLVQYELLRHGIDSAPMTTDAGIDLVAYSPDKKSSFTIQVKTNLAPKPGGGKGAAAIDWWVNEDCPAEWFALADISTCRLWMLTRQELATAAQQRSNGRLHLYMYTDPHAGSRAYRRNGALRFSEFLFENRSSLLCYGESQK